MRRRVLVLNTSYMPINVISWRRAICLVYIGKAEVVCESEHVVRSVNSAMKIPSVVKLKYFNKFPQINIRFNKKNIFLRDNYVCQYCGKKFSATELTLDHVIPKKLNGKTCWENIVTCCIPCNTRKSEYVLNQVGMKLLSKPKKPFYIPSLLIKRGATEQDMADWKQFFVR